MIKSSTSNSSHFIKATLLITVFSFLSRVLGVFRSTLLNSIYGATESKGIIDCYVAAYRLPDIIFNLVAAGSISIVLIPYFSGFMKKNDNEDLNKACSSFLNFFFIVMSIVLIIMFFFAKFIVANILVAGWTDQANIELTVKLSRILLLQVLFMTLSSVFGSYLNSIEKFFAYSLAMLSYNVGIIAGILFIAPFLGIEGVIWGTVIGSLIHFFIQMSGSIKNGFKYTFSLPKFDREIRELFAVAIPRIIAISSDQLVRFTVITFASFIFTGSMIIFDNVENVGMVFYGMLAVSVSTTAFPGFVRLYNEKRYEEMFSSFLEKIRFMLFLMLPATVFMTVFRTDIIELLFRYGRFNPTDRMLTSGALAVYMTGIPFLSITILTVKYYYAMKKSLIPMFAALTAIVVTVLTSYYLSPLYGVSGLAAGRSAGFIIQALILMIFLLHINSNYNLKITRFGKILTQILTLLLCSIAMLLCGILLKKILVFSNGSKLDSIISIIVDGFAISVLYIIMCMIFKNPDIGLFIGKFKNILRIGQ